VKVVNIVESASEVVSVSEVVEGAGVRGPGVRGKGSKGDKGDKGEEAGGSEVGAQG
jgi:hypothetical protein